MSKEASATYKVTILDAVFKACKVKVDSAILGNDTNAILKSPARRSYLKTDVKMTNFQIKPVSFTGTMSET